MEKIIVWGTGKIADKLFPAINDEIVLVVDNDKKKWGTIWNGFTVKSPSVIVDFNGNFDRVVIASIYWKEIRRQIIEECGVDSSLIDNMYYRQKQYLLNHYKKNMECDKEKYILFLQQHPLDVFNDNFVDKYENLDMEVYFDSEQGLYYVYHNNKKMYFSAEFSKKEHVKRYYSFLLMEQDKDSPHRYQTDRFCVHSHDIVLDAGVAEGNFALDIIDLVDKLYLIECDKEWIKALKCTFEPYKDKVEIIEGMLGNGLEESKTIDEIIGNDRIDFIKMDIEGAEYEALCGGRQSLERNDVKLAVCAYHHADDQKRTEKLLEKVGYETAVSDGYMIFITEQFFDKEVYSPQFVRGLIRGKRRR